MKCLPFTLALLAVGWVELAEAEIYRWVDAQGQVHFDQRPRQGAEQVQVRPQVIQREDHVRESEQNRQRLFEVREREREQQRAQNAQQRQQRLAHCEQMREQLARFEGRVYWYEEDANGQRVEASNEQVRASRDALHKQLRERC